MRAGSACPDGTIAVIGGGASGVLVAAHLLRAARQPLDVVIVDSRAPLGAGVAYSTGDARHLVNSPSCEMSAFGDRPGDLIGWACAQGCEVARSDFVPRSLYGRYLSHVLAEARRQTNSASGLSWFREDVVALTRQSRPDGTAFVLGFAGGGHLDAGHVVIAVGPPSPRAPWSGDAELIGHPGLIEDPWEPRSLDRIGPKASVLLVGTGLTMVDVALTIAGGGTNERSLYARSRHGLLPLAHRTTPVEAWRGRLETAETARELVRAIRVEAEKIEFAGGDWRSVVATVRRQVPELWSALPVAEQRRLLRLGLRYWEVHRHRMAPAVDAALTRLRQGGRLDVGPGRLLALSARGAKLRAQIGRARGDEVLDVDVVVNCTGATGGYPGGSRLLGQLVRTGLATVDGLGLGLEVDEHGDLVGADGASDPGLHVVGWARRGQLLESTAIPEIRAQAERLARRLTGAHP
jgi:uncharacterized NAD(P)/FAD-binding protein YdhS